VNDEQAIIDRFAELWWRDNETTFFENTWLGVPAFQHPFDVWVTQEIIVEVKPELIVEAGSFAGGSAVLWATIQEQIVPDGRVIAIDLADNMDVARTVPIFDRKVDFFCGSSVDPEIVAEVRRRAEGRRTMVILDSAHTEEHVAAEIEAYSPIVSPGSYLVVQDTFVNGHPLEPDWGPGPHEAVEAFLRRTDEFEVDQRRERMKFTFNRNGFLRRSGDRDRAPQP
jgi:cephalosporin hydroxylase